MNRKRFIVFLSVLLIIGISSAWAADNITGLWKIIDDKTGKPTAFVLLYIYNSKLYGRMVATIDKDTGLVDDNMDIKKNRATALEGEPFYCGLDFVYELTERAKDWKGSIMDPEEGKEYDCTIKRDGDSLVVRGSLKGTGGLLGRNQTWLLASAAEIPNFTIPSSRSFIPVIPKKKKK